MLSWRRLANHIPYAGKAADGIDKLFIQAERTASNDLIKML